ncbi:MAG: 50S ribosomal protein L28 [Janthinobacterium lividum]
MSRRCELSGVGVQYGNKVSHSQRKTRRRFEPNMRVVRFLSEVLGQQFRLRVNAHCMRSVEKAGGIDHYIIKIKEDKLSINAKTLRKKIIDRKSEILP